MKFKTNAKCSGCVAAIGVKLNTILKKTEWNINLNSPEKILTVYAAIPAAIVIEAVEAAGYQAEELDV